MQTGVLKKTDPGKIGENDVPDWVNFANDYDNRQKMSSNAGYEANIRKKRKDKFQRVSRKMSSITDFTHSRGKNPARTEAFKFKAFDRADAFRNVDYIPGDDIYGKGFAVVPVAWSVTSDQKSVTEELQAMGTDAWMGMNQGGMTPPVSDAQGSIRSARSIADLQELEQYPGPPADSSSERESSKKGSLESRLQFVKAPDSSSQRTRLQSVGSSEGSDIGKPAYARVPGVIPETQRVPSGRAVAVPTPEDDTTLQHQARIDALKVWIGLHNRDHGLHILEAGICRQEAC